MRMAIVKMTLDHAKLWNHNEVDLFRISPLSFKTFFPVQSLVTYQDRNAFMLSGTNGSTTSQEAHQIVRNKNAIEILRHNG